MRCHNELRYDQLNLPESLLKLQSDTNSAMNTVTAYGPGYVDINEQRYEHAVAFGPTGVISSWSARNPSDISTDLLLAAARISMAKPDPMAFLDASEEPEAIITGERPEVLLIGTGSKQILLAHHIVAPILKIGIGVECMSTEAAARTYNILMSEGRRVIAALLTEAT